MSGDGISRRGMLGGAAALVAATALPTEASPDAGALRSASGAVPDAGVPSISESALADAEKVALVEYTPKQRKQILEVIDDQLAAVRMRRGLELPNALAPALGFDPLSGIDVPLPKKNTLKRTSFSGALPSRDEDIAFAPVWQLSRWIQSRSLSSERLTSIYLARLKELGPKLRCLVTLVDAPALEQARAADRELSGGHSRGPLHGIPYGAKDLFDTAGITTGWGAEPYRHRVPSEDASVIRRLRQAGAILVAKLSLGALAYNDIWYGGKTLNPWFLEEGSSGSSAGSAAATAAGLVGFAIGTETLGSIVSPSMRCGTTGLRPTHGRVSRAGAMALCWSMDKVGPIGRAVEDTALVLSAIHGADPADAKARDLDARSVPLELDLTASPRGLRVGYVPKLFEDKGTTEVDRHALEMLRTLGVALREVKLPELPYDALGIIVSCEAAAAFEELTLKRLDDELAWQDKEAWPNTFRAARFITAIDFVQAQRLRRRLMHEWSEMMGKVDLLISPSLIGPPLPATNFTGHPSLTLRAGFLSIHKPRGEDEIVPSGPATLKQPREVPHGITLWGRLFDEGSLVRVGLALERALKVSARRPPEMERGG